MTTKPVPTGTTITATLGAPHPAGAVKRQTTTPAPAPSTKAASFAAWKDAIGTARGVTGYDTASPIYGRTDIEVLTDIQSDLAKLAARLDDPAKFSPSSNQDFVRAIKENYVSELLKRKIAKVLAGQSLKTHKS